MGTPRLDFIDRNILINGGLDYWQYVGAAAANLTTSRVYAAMDRFGVKYAGTVTGTPTVQRSAVVPSSDLKYSALFVGRRNGTTLDYTINQRVESNFARDLIGKPLSLGCQVNSEICTSVTLKVSYATAVDNFAAVTLISSQTVAVLANSTWQTAKFENITLPSSITNGIEIEYILSAPSATDGATKNTYLSAIKANATSVLQEFSRAGRDIAEELRLCQRYYCKTYDPDTKAGTATSDSQQMTYSTGNASSSYTIYSCWRFPVSMRVSPVVHPYSSGGTIDTAYVSSVQVAAGTGGYLGTDSCTITANSSGASTIRSLSYQATADAEL